MTHVLLIGLDGATFDLIEPLIAQGYLPNLARLMSEGSYGRLASTLHPLTAPAWVTCLTGVNQGQHGIYDFVRRRPNTYAVDITHASDYTAPTFLDAAGQAGKRVIAINIPYTFPPRPVNGLMVGGPFAPALTRAGVYPPQHFDTLTALIPDYFILPDYEARAADPLAAYARRLQQEIEQRERASRHFMQTEAWDIFMLVSMATDEAHHTFWQCLEAPEGSPLARYRNVIRDVYVRADALIGNLVTQARSIHDDTVVAVLSDHGGGELRSLINLNHWLAEQGHLRFQAETTNRWRHWRAKGLARLARVYKHYVPGPVRAFIRTALGAQSFNRVKGELQSSVLANRVDWSHTRVYALGAGGNLYVNLKGREPQGIVEPGPAYEQLRDALVKALELLSDPETGQRIVRRVHRREEIYQGAYLPQAPDLIIEWADYAYWGRGGYDDPGKPVFERQRQFDWSDQPLSGAHRPEGILLLHGPGIRAGQILTGARLLDIAPTVFSLVGAPALSMWEGRALEESFESGYYAPATGPLANSDSVTALDDFDYSPEDAARISQHLKDLGYL